MTMEVSFECVQAEIRAFSYACGKHSLGAVVSDMCCSAAVVSRVSIEMAAVNGTVVVSRQV